MKPDTFKERLLVEHEQLVERLTKLTSFLWGEVFNARPNKDRELLIEQLAFMRSYERVLAERISRV